MRIAVGDSEPSERFLCCFHCIGALDDAIASADRDISKTLLLSVQHARLAE